MAKRLLGLGALAIALVTATNAGAYWTSSGTGSGSGNVGTLNAPSLLSATPGAGTVALSWSAVTPPGSGSVTYYVSRNGGNPGGNCPGSAAPTSVLTCTDSGLSAGTYSYTVTAVWRTWTATSSPATTVTLASGALDHLVLTAASTTPAAGQADNLTVTAKDSAGNTVTVYAGSHNLTFAGANAIGIFTPTVTNSSGTAVNFGSATAINFTSGVATVSGSNNGVMRLYRAETASITVNEGGSYASSALSVTVAPLAINSLSLSAASTTPAAGQADNLTVTARDQYGNTATSYTGSHSLTFAGATAIGAFNPTVTNSSGTAVNFGTATALSFTNGVATVSGSSNGVMRLYRAETASITVNEGGSYASSALSVTVSAAAINRLSLSAASTTPAAGQADNLTVTALDQYGNTATSYAGSHSLTFSGAGSIGTFTPTVTNSSGTAVNFGTSTAITFTSGVATVSGSNNGVMRLYKAETASITVNEGGSYASSPLSITVSATAINRLSLAAGTNPSAGQADNLTITALDQYGNTATSYTGSHTLTFAGATAIGAFNPTVTNSSGTAVNFGTATAITFANGVATVSGSSNGVMRLYKAETASITVNDGGSYTSSALSVTVAPLAINSFSMTAATTTPAAGQADNLTITALDQYGNTATSYTSSHSLTFSGATAIGAFNPTVSNSSGTAVNFGTATALSFTNGVATVSGSSNGVMKLYRVETAHVVVSDGTYTNGAGLTVTVGGGAFNSFTIPTPATQTAGTAFAVSLTAYDAYGNTLTGYTGVQCVAFSGPATSPGGNAPSYPAQGSCAAGQSAVTFTNGVASPSITLYNASASTVLTATDATSGKSGSTGSFAVSGAGINTYTIPTPATQTAGTAFSVSLTAKDAYGNTLTGYTGAHCVAFSGPSSSPGGSAPAYPAQGACAAGQSAVTFTNGVANPSMTLYNASTSTVLTATDATSGKSGSSGAFTVNPLAINSFSMTAATTTPAAGQADNLTITALDQYGNTATSYTSSHSLTFSGATAIGAFNPTVSNNSGTAINFGAATAITFTNGVATVSGSSNGVMRLYKAETAHVVVSDGTYTNGTGLTVTVAVGALNSFTVPTPATQTAGTAFAVSLTAYDAYGNVKTDYNGTQCVTFSGPTASPNGTAPLYPAQGSCAAGQSAVTFTNGVAGPSITLYDATASTTLTVTDVATGRSGSTGSFAVNGLATVSTLVLTAATTTPTAGQADNVTITAGDSYGNLVTTYTGNHDLTFSGASPIGTYRPTVTNSSGTAINFGSTTTINFTNGSATAVMTLYRAQSANIVVTDGSNSNGAGLHVTVSPAALSGLSLAADKTVVRPGVADNLTVRTVDAYDNTVPGFTGSRNLTFAGASMSGTTHPTVSNSSGTAINFGAVTAINFTNGVASVSGSANGVMRLYALERANITVTDGTYTSAALSVVVSNVAATAVSAGGFHNCALVAGGVQCWGYNNYGQLGNNSTTNSSTPVKVVGVGGTGYLSNVTQISAGKYHTCAVVSSGAVYCWGQNIYAQLGNNSTTNSSTPVQVRTSTTTYLTNVTQVGSGGGHTCALRTDNTVYCWGRNAFGEVGDNTTTQRQMAVQVHINGTTHLTNAVQIAIGTNHSCARLSDNTARCWGYNVYGEVGDNSTTNRSVATLVVGTSGSGTLGGITDLSSGRFHTCARLSDGSVYCWGWNSYGQLGNGNHDTYLPDTDSWTTDADSSVPVQVLGITTATQISAGEYHSCATLADGTAQCWGAAAFGQVGDGTTADTSVPVTVIGPGGYGSLSGVVSISAGGGNWPDGTGTDNYEHTIALLSDGTVVSWGQNIYGQLGDGTTTMSISPVGVALL